MIERFKALIEPIFPSPAERGWLPFWHLMRDRAWVCYQGGKLVKRTVFRVGQPKSFKQLLTHVEYAAVPNDIIGAWRDPVARKVLQERMAILLLEETDVASQAVGEYLRCRFDLAPGRALARGNTLEDKGEFDQRRYIEDYSRFRVHILIERNKRLTDTVKRVQGYTCRLCGFNFEHAYGDIGRWYIEAHHLTPVSARKGAAVELDPTKDFAVLCSNCHRMIHRSKSIGDLNAFRVTNKVPSCDEQ